MALQQVNICRDEKGITRPLSLGRVSVHRSTLLPFRKSRPLKKKLMICLTKLNRQKMITKSPLIPPATSSPSPTKESLSLRRRRFRFNFRFNFRSTLTAAPRYHGSQSQAPSFTTAGQTRTARTTRQTLGTRRLNAIWCITLPPCLEGRMELNTLSPKSVQWWNVTEPVCICRLGDEIFSRRKRSKWENGLPWTLFGGLFRKCIFAKRRGI